MQNLSVDIAPNCNFKIRKMTSFPLRNKAILKHCQNSYFCRSILAKQAEDDVNLTRIGSDQHKWRCKSTMEIDIIATISILVHSALLNRNCIIRQILDSFCSLCWSKLGTRKLFVQLLCQIMLSNSNGITHFCNVLFSSKEMQC